MLIGLYTSILETNSRLTLPGDFRGQFKEGLILTQGFDQNIMVLTTDAFRAIYERITSFNLADPLARLLLRMVFGSAHEIQLETDGTIAIPERLKNLAQLKGDVVLVGQGNYIELWSPEVWSTQEQMLIDVQGNQDRFSSLALSIG